MIESDIPWPKPRAWRAMSALAISAACTKLHTASAEAAKTAGHLNEVRHRAGAVQLRNWLDAQEIRRQAEIALAVNRLARVQNYAAVCQALGGDAGSTAGGTH